MSRVGRSPVPIPPEVVIQLIDDVAGVRAVVKGAQGELNRTFHPFVAIAQEDGQLIVSLREESSKGSAIHGLSRALLNNMVVGVSQGFQKTLEISGAGYRAQATETSVTLQVGHSHPVTVDAPSGVTVRVEANTRVHVAGADKQAVGETAARIRAVRKPGVYTGKGIRYSDEQVRRKAGKGAGRRK